MFVKKENFIESYNPANKEFLGSIQITTDSQITEIVSQCRNAFRIWASYSFDERGKRLKKFADIIESRANELATLMTKEMGKTSLGISS